MLFRSVRHDMHASRVSGRKSNQIGSLRFAVNEHCVRFTVKKLQLPCFKPAMNDPLCPTDVVGSADDPHPCVAEPSPPERQRQVVDVGKMHDIGAGFPHVPYQPMGIGILCDQKT